jgi:flagellar hook assembly protein FlgD
LRDFVPDISGVEVADIPEVVLNRNVPNPFSSKTSISYSMKTDGKARLAVYTLTGRLVKNLVDGYVEPGSHSASWDGRDNLGNEVASGVYYYRLESESGFQVGKMTLLR